ncbi:MAG: molecular chaperone DnaJ [Nanoarchaeota archaeon]
MAKKDYYEILNISKNASKDEVKKAYKELAKKYHPDITKDNSTEEKFKEISEAYAVLSDDQKRAQYDQFGHEAFDQRFTQEDIFRDFDFGIFRDSGFGDFDNLFDIFFGRNRAKRKGIDLRYDLELSFEEAAFGCKKEIEIPKHEICTSCNGSGAYKNKFETCKACKGTGQVKNIARSFFGIVTQIYSCNDCEGTGKVIKEKCKSCNGKGLIKKTKILEVKIPAGIDNGNQIKLEDEGEIGEEGNFGDLYIIPHILPHKLFTREGYNIYLEVPLKFSTAVLGGILEVPTLNGKANLKIPPGTQSHTIFRLKGEGIKKLNSYGYGDEYVRVLIEVPKDLDKKQKELLKELDKNL